MTNAASVKGVQSIVGPFPLLFSSLVSSTYADPVRAI